MRIEEALFRYLSGSTALALLVGSGTAARLYEIEAPEGTSHLDGPYVVYELQSDNRTEAMSAAPSAKTAAFTFSIYAASPVTADGVHDALYAALIDPPFSGVMGGGPTVQSCLFRGKRTSVVADYTPASLRAYLVETDIDFAVNL